MPRILADAARRQASDHARWTVQYAQAYCRISSTLQTMAYRDYNPLTAIRIALPGELYAEPTE